MKKKFRSGATTLTISNDEKNDIMKILKYLEESSLLIKGVSKTIKNEAKEQKGGSLGMLLGTLRASLLENLLTGKGTIRQIWSWSRFLMLPHPLKCFEIKTYYQNKHKFNGVFSKNNLPKIKDGALGLIEYHHYMRMLKM